MKQIVRESDWKEFIYFEDLPGEDREYWQDLFEEPEAETFIEIEGSFYPLSNFVCYGSVWSPSHPEELSEWDGYHTESFFSAILIKLSDCGDAYKTALLLS